MDETTLAVQQIEPADIKRVPQDEAVRCSIRELAGRLAAELDTARPPLRAELEQRAAAILERLSLPRHFLGFVMVALSNAFWRPQFEGTSFKRRLLFLPCCLRDHENCKGTLDSAGLDCVGCCDCTLNQLKTAAEDLGCRVLIAEGTPAVVAQLMECDADAIAGVACLDSLEKAFNKVAAVGIPCAALPLLKDGCVSTEAEIGYVLSVLRAKRAPSAARSRTYAPLLRESVAIFEPGSLAGLLEPVLPRPGEPGGTDAIALDWLGAGGKRFRPFVTLAAYAVSKHGAGALAADAGAGSLIPAAVRGIALAIEALHKASLVHDDIEDGDAFRYGRETLHRTYGVGPAINVGDYLIGLGYRLISAQAGALGKACVADIHAQLSAAHIELCRGQGDELLRQRDPGRALKPIDALAIYALKTAPAFEAALFAGLRAAGAEFDAAALKQYSVYVGEAYQILNDLDDWEENEQNKVAVGRDARAERPTLMRAFALEAGAADKLARADGDAGRVRRIYEEIGAFDRAERLVGKLRARAVALADEAQEPGLADLLHFIVRIVL